MFQVLKQLFSPTNKDLRKRIGFTLLGLAIFVVGTKVRVPGTTDLTGNLGFLELVNAMGGNALKQFSILALGVMPYITAQIIMQLLQMDIVPYFSELAKEGPVGRRKLNSISRYVGIAFAFIEGFAYSYAFLGQSAGVTDYIYVATILTAGTAFTLWLGDQITQKGIGNGISLIIMAGIVESMPTMFVTAFNDLVNNSLIEKWLGILLFVVLMIVYLLIIIGIIFVENGNRKIPIQYANKSTSSYGGEQNFMPIKVNSAGVVPVIFASSLLAIPATVARFINKEGFTNFVDNYLTYTKPVGFIIYVLLIFAFAYVYTFIEIRPDETAKNLKESGGYVPGIKPGKDTENYISKVIGRLTIAGSVALVFIATIPIIFSALINLIDGVSLSSNVTIGGTGLLIAVGVCQETFKQLEGSLVTRNYLKGYSRK